MADRHHLCDFGNIAFHPTMLLRICSAFVACLTWLSTCSFPISHPTTPPHLAGILVVGVLAGTLVARLGGVFVEEGSQGAMVYMRGYSTWRAARMSACSRTASPRRTSCVPVLSANARRSSCTAASLCILNTRDEFGNAGGDVDCGDGGGMASVRARRSREVQGSEKCSPSCTRQMRYTPGEPGFPGAGGAQAAEV